MSENAAAEQITMPKHGEFCWTEIATNNLETCKSFYSNVFGWEYKGTDATGGGFEYLEFGINPRNSGALYQINPNWFEGNPPPPHFLVYIAVDDVDEIATKAFDLGARIIKPPMEIPNVGKMCIINDPTGAMIAFITLKH
jgi:uncharacterized protein